MLVVRVAVALTLAVAVAVAVTAGSTHSPVASRVNAADGPPTCFGKPATIVGDGALRGTSGADVIVATNSSSEVHSGRGNDRICGSPLAYGGDGNDRILLGRARSGDIELMGQQGADLIMVTAPVFAFLYGGPGPDRLKGRTGEQWLSGGTGHDRLLGGGGPDHLLGGEGRDLARGGDGVDSCEAERVRDCERD